MTIEVLGKTVAIPFTGKRMYRGVQLFWENDDTRLFWLVDSLADCEGVVAISECDGRVTFYVEDKNAAARLSRLPGGVFNTGSLAAVRRKYGHEEH
jgi:hypothetical protein